MVIEFVVTLKMNTLLMLVSWFEDENTGKLDHYQVCCHIEDKHVDDVDWDQVGQSL
jgi:hypothetical protein